MRTLISFFCILLFLLGCSRDESVAPVAIDNPEVELPVPVGFPGFTRSLEINKPTKYGVELGVLLFNEKRLSSNNTISCASCHMQANAFADANAKAIGVYDRVGLRNAPPVQNMAFMQFYNWDGNILQLEKQPLVPIITHEEMDSSILEVIDKLKDDPTYKELLKKAFGDDRLTPERIYNTIAQYEYTLISANSKYDRVKRREGDQFTTEEARGNEVFKVKCASCHSTELFTDQSFRNIGFPVNPNTDEAGRARLTGRAADYMAFRVPSLRNVEYTAPYGSFGQFATLMDVLNYFDSGVLNADNLDPIFKENGNRLPLSNQEKSDLISFLKTLSDKKFVAR